MKGYDKVTKELYDLMRELPNRGCDEVLMLMIVQKLQKIADQLAHMDTVV